MAPPRARFVSVGDGRRLHVVEYGPTGRDRRPPLLCLPGLVRNSRDFTLLGERIGATRRVVCLDYRGRGLSEREPDWRRYTAATDLADIFHVRCARHIERAIVVGTSYGGLLAMALGASQPSMLAGVILNDICPEPEPGAVDAIVDAVGRDRAIESLDAAPDALRALFPTIRFQSPALLEAAARNTFRKAPDGRFHVDWDVAIARRLRAAPASQPLWPLYRSLRHIPALALRGALSGLLSPACFDRMAAEKPDLARVTVPETAHAPTLEEPEARAAIDAFIAGL